MGAKIFKAGKEEELEFIFSWEMLGSDHLTDKKR
jgi:hypothetical protein